MEKINFLRKAKPEQSNNDNDIIIESEYNVKLYYS